MVGISRLDISSDILWTWTNETHEGANTKVHPEPNTAPSKVAHIELTWHGADNRESIAHKSRSVYISQCHLKCHEVLLHSHTIFCFTPWRHWTLLVTMTNISQNVQRQLFLRMLRYWIRYLSWCLEFKASESTQLVLQGCFGFFFHYHLATSTTKMSSHFHRFVILYIMLRYTKWEDWSLTITKSVQCRKETI